MNIHLIIGEDEYLVSETAKKTVGDGVGLELIDSLTASNAELQLADLRRAEESLATPPFLDPKKVTWWKNVGFLPGTNKVAEDVKDALERFAERLAAAKLPENQHFILSGPRLLKTSVFAKRLATAAEVVSFATEKPREAMRSAVDRLREYAAAENLSFAPGVDERMVAIVGTDARSLRSEIAKMRAYLGPKASLVKAEDVQAIASPGANVEAELWDVTDAVGARNADAALVAIRKFELESGFDVFMSTVLEKFFRQLIDVKRGRTEGLNPYVVRKNMGFAAKWSEQELLRARARFLKLRERVVSGTTAGPILVITELLAALRYMV